MTIVFNRILTVLAWAGVFVSGVLSVGHLLNKGVPCGINKGCEVVANHPSSVWFGIPVAYFGLAAYLTFAALAALRAAKGEAAKATILPGFVMSIFGLMSTIYLQLIAITVIRARCDWCIASAVIMALTFLGYASLAQASNDPKRVVPSATPAGAADRFLAIACVILTIGGIGTNAAIINRQLPPTQRELTGQRKIEDFISDSRYFKGPADAPITIIEYADTFCPGCRSAFPILKDFMKAHPDKIRWGYQHFPLYEKEDHKFALPAAIMSEYAMDKGKYFEFIERLFYGEADTLASLEGLKGAAKDVGLDGDEAVSKVQSADATLIDRVATARTRATSMQIEMTPSFVIFIKGQKPFVAQGGDGLRSMMALPAVEAALGGKPQ